MAEIRSALEIALEKADKLGKASKEELQADEARSKGRRIVAVFLDDPKKTSLKESLSEVEPNELNYVIEGAMDTLTRNVFLPMDDVQMQRIQKALAGIMDIKGSMAAQVINGINELVRQFQQTYTQYKEQLKTQMQSRLGSIQQAMAQQYGMGAAQGLDAEAIPEFQKEWSKLSQEIKQQFGRELDKMKQYLLQI